MCGIMSTSLSNVLIPTIEAHPQVSTQLDVVDLVQSLYERLDVDFPRFTKVFDYSVIINWWWKIVSEAWILEVIGSFLRVFLEGVWR